MFLSLTATDVDSNSIDDVIMDVDDIVIVVVTIVSDGDSHMTLKIPPIPPLKPVLRISKNIKNI